MKCKKIILIGIGFICLVLGGIGVILPMLPTTPFVIVASICFSSSSQRFYDYLAKSKHFGVYLENYKNHTGIPMKAKKKAMIFLWLSLFLSMMIVQKIWITLLLLFIGSCVSAHILMIKTRKM